MIKMLADIPMCPALPPGVPMSVCARMNKSWILIVNKKLYDAVERHRRGQRAQRVDHDVEEGTQEERSGGR